MTADERQTLIDTAVGVIQAEIDTHQQHVAELRQHKGKAAADAALRDGITRQLTDLAALRDKVKAALTAG